MALLRLHVPKDPVEAVAYLDTVRDQVEDLLRDRYANAYFQARLDGHFEEALAVGRTSRKQALRLVRQVNDRMGRPVRWRDNLDPAHSTYAPD